MIQKVTSKHQSGEQTHVIHQSSMHHVHSPPKSHFPPLTSTYYFCVSDYFFFLPATYYHPVKFSQLLEDIPLWIRKNTEALFIILAKPKPNEQNAAHNLKVSPQYAY